MRFELDVKKKRERFFVLFFVSNWVFIEWETKKNLNDETLKFDRQISENIFEIELLKPYKSINFYSPGINYLQYIFFFFLSWLSELGID